MITTINLNNNSYNQINNRMEDKENNLHDQYKKEPEHKESDLELLPNVNGRTAPVYPKPIVKNELETRYPSVTHYIVEFLLTKSSAHQWGQKKTKDELGLIEL